jgi:hypothetical protein
VAGDAHAQRIPTEFIWFAGAGLLAPFVAIPAKLGILRLLDLRCGCSRLWSISAIEWAIWFPLAFLLFRSGRQSTFPLIALFLFGAAAWLHKLLVANTSWRSAVLLTFPTPILALLLPFLAFASAAFLDSLAA